jgi:farnesyl-diphosphate farnesyltransferase
MFSYARRNLQLARKRIEAMPAESYRFFVEIPLHLAEATLEAIKNGIQKLSREEVLRIVNELT